MKGYLIDKLDYYSGRYNQYFLKALVAREGGSNSHIDLLTYLFNYSFSNPQGNYSDLRPLSSLLHLLPSKACIFLSFYLQLEERLIGMSVIDRYAVQVMSPFHVLQLNSAVLDTSIGNRITSLLKEDATEIMGYELANLLGLSYQMPKSPYLSTRLESIYNLLDLDPRDIELLNNLFCTRDRSKTLTYLSNNWGYGANTLYELKGLLYEWNQI
jgi:hypothetical protein